MGRDWTASCSMYFCWPICSAPCSAACIWDRSTERGAIRNKLMAGHSRNSVYLAGLLCSIVGSLFLVFAACFGALAFGLPLIGGFQLTARAIALLLLCGVGVTVVYASVYTLLSLLISSRALSVAACLLTSIVLMSFSQKIFSALEQPEHILSQYVFTENGATLLENAGEGPLNPDYVDGVQRTVFQFINDLLPTGQAFQIANLSVERPWLLLGCSLALVLLTTGLGLFLFRKKRREIGGVWMIAAAWITVALLLCAVAALGVKVILLRRGARELREGLH